MALPADIQAEMDHIDRLFDADGQNAGKFMAGRLLSIPMGDGYAVYEVTKVTPKTATVKWRPDAAMDDWQDQILGDGGTFPRDRIEPLVERQDRISSLFGK